MTRCSYIPPEGQSVIAIAKERGGTTDGDIRALVDRFGCKAEATLHAVEEDPGEREVLACADHLGHMLDDSLWSIGPVWTPQACDIADITISIANTQGIARAGFGEPITFGWPTAQSVTDLGTNPTREQLDAVGLCSAGDAYREALRALYHRLPTHPSRSPTTIVLRSGNEQIELRPSSVTPGHDGSSATQRIVTSLIGNQFETLERWRHAHETLERWRRTHALVRIDADPAPYAIVEMSFAGDSQEEWDMTLVLKQIRLDRMTVQQRNALDHAQRTATCDIARGIHVLGENSSAGSCQCGRPFYAR